MTKLILRQQIVRVACKMKSQIRLKIKFDQVEHFLYLNKYEKDAFDTFFKSVIIHSETN